MIRRIFILFSVLIGSLGAAAVFPYFPAESFISEGYICEFYFSKTVISIIGIKPEKLSEIKDGHVLSFPEMLESEGETYPVQLLGHQALHQYDLSGITELVLHDTFRFVLPYAINDAPSIEKLVIGKSIEDISYKNLTGMTGMKEIHFQQRGNCRFSCSDDFLEHAPNSIDIYVCDSEPFEFCHPRMSALDKGAYDKEFLYPPKCTLHVPAGSSKAYASTPFWEDFGTIVEDSGAGAEATAADSFGWGCDIIRGGIEISGLSDDAVRIFTPDGRLFRQAVPDGQFMTIQLPVGIYIVSASGRSVRVAVR